VRLRQFKQAAGAEPRQKRLVTPRVGSNASVSVGEQQYNQRQRCHAKQQPWTTTMSA
jgi:hypothetical protein